jgi:hypothetical protein
MYAQPVSGVDADQVTFAEPLPAVATPMVGVVIDAADAGVAVTNTDVTANNSTARPATAERRMPHRDSRLDEVRPM